jgi:hypothetical protein
MNPADDCVFIDFIHQSLPKSASVRLIRISKINASLFIDRILAVYSSVVCYGNFLHLRICQEHSTAGSRWPTTIDSASCGYSLHLTVLPVTSPGIKEMSQLDQKVELSLNSLIRGT